MALGGRQPHPRAPHRRNQGGDDGQVSANTPMTKARIGDRGNDTGILQKQSMDGEALLDNVKKNLLNSPEDGMKKSRSRSLENTGTKQLILIRGADSAHPVR